MKLIAKNIGSLTFSLPLSLNCKRIKVMVSFLFQYNVLPKQNFTPKKMFTLSKISLRKK